MTGETFSSGRVAALFAGALAFAVIAMALVLEHGFGYAPCPLCLEQRWPYYIGVPAAFLLAAIGGRLGPRILAIGLVALAALFARGLYLGVYQAGAEWRFWQGPTDCAGAGGTPGPADVGDLMSAIQSSVVVSCTDPSLRIFGVSLAGWNAVVMAGLIAVLLAGAWKELRG